MAGVAGVVATGHGGPVSNNGAKMPYDTTGPASSQENTVAVKPRPNALRQSSSGSSRMPLSALTANRKDSGTQSRAPYNRVEELGQQNGGLIRSGSESDSLLDLYRSNPSSGNVSQQAGQDGDIPENMYRPHEDDPEGWIHRDKLAKIESEELQAAGINLANARRNVGKGAKRDNSRGRKSEERPQPESRKAEAEEPRAKRSEALQEEADEEDERVNWDFRTPDEIAADNTSSPIYSNPVLRKSGSKIPVLTSSPHPIPPERIERDTPLNRKRTISNSMSPEEGIPVLKTRLRKGSTGSQPLQDLGDMLDSTPGTANNSAVATPKTSSPTKSRPKTAQSSPTEASTGKKASATNRKPSANTKTAIGAPAGQRPGTRSGELDRPRTAVNRPEGDPPWLATMYKPDPMLPPDQQIIPTHARRQQVAQWETDGRVPRTYDRNFSPLAIHTGNGLVKEPSPGLQPSPSLRGEEDSDRTAWPLKPNPSVRHSSGSRPGTSGSNHGGYSTMPKVTSPALIQSPRMGNISATPTQPSRMQVQRLEPDDVEEKGKEKGCSCCVVM